MIGSAGNRSPNGPTEEIVLVFLSLFLAILRLHIQGRAHLGCAPAPSTLPTRGQIRSAGLGWSASPWCFAILFRFACASITITILALADTQMKLAQIASALDARL